MRDARSGAEPNDVRPIVIVPVGSWEQHGPHLPFDTDSVIACEVARRAATRLHDEQVLLVNAVNFSASGEHADFPGTLSIGTQTTARILVELARSCDWAAGIVFVNGHGGNADAFREAMASILAEGRRALSWTPTTTDPRDTHAGHIETSVMLAIDPSRVRMDRAAKGSMTPITDLMSELRDNGLRSVSDNGVLGDPTNANPTDGERILAAWTNSLVEQVRLWSREST